MRTIFILALLAGVSALKQSNKPHGYGEIVQLAMKSRSVSDVTEALEEEPVDDTAKVILEKAHGKHGGRGRRERIVDQIAGTEESKEESDPTKPVDEGAELEEDQDPVTRFLGSNSGCFAVYLLLTGLSIFGVWYSLKMALGVTVQADEVEDYSRGALFYNKVAPGAMIFMTFMMFCSVIGGVIRLNLKIDDQNPKTNYPGYEGKSVLHEAIENPGERALFAAFGLVAQAVLGIVICLYLRKSQEVQISLSMIMKMACRGFAAGVIVTMIVEFIRLPFHNFMKYEEHFIVRFFMVLFWVAFVVLGEEAMKIGAVALGLKRNENDEPTIPGHALTHYVAESTQALAICGFAAGLGFAFVENIPRYYALSMEQPLVTFTASDYFSSQAPEEIFLVSEGDLRATRFWVFFVWGLLNINPWLTGIAAIQLANFKSLLTPNDWFKVLKFVLCVHYFFDLFDRSTNASVEIFGCLAIPFAIYTFRKQWMSLEAGGDGILADNALLTDHE